ncbi:MAG: YncE family protein [Gemmatimonadaceae bacterium]
MRVSAALSTLSLTAALLGRAVPAQPAPQNAGGYALAKKIPVGGEGGWDYALVDPVGRRLYVSHATKAVVIDLVGDSVVGEVRDTPGIHGIAVARAFNRGFTSNGRDSTVTVFDLKTLAPIQRITVTGANPDAIWYDEASQRVFTFNGRSSNATAIDAKTGTVIGTIALAGKPEFAQTDGKGRLFVNIETETGQIQVVDTKALRVTKTYALPGCEGPSGLAYDAGHDRLFSVCGNNTMAVSNPTAGALVTTIKIGPGVDAAAYDAARGLVFASNGGDGTLSVIRQTGADTYQSLGTAATMRGSRTMALDPSTHTVYLASVEYGPTPAPTAQQPRPRPAVVPGSFAILVLRAP